MNKSYFVRFNNKDYQENPNLLIELLELEHQFQEVIEDYDEKIKWTTETRAWILWLYR